MIEIRFLPVAFGDRSRFCEIFGWPQVSPSGGSAAVTVTGNGTPIANNDSTPSAGDFTQFPGVTVGATNIDRTFSITNNGSATLTLASLSVPTGFTVVSTFSASVAPGGSTSITLRLDTATVGTRSGDVSFETNVTGSETFTFAIAGVVSPAVAPAISVTGNGAIIVNGDASPSLTDHTQFIDAGQGNGGTLRSFTVSNPGGATLTIADFAVPTGFSVVTALPSTLAPTASATVTIRLDDATLGVKSGNVSFTTNVTGETSWTFAIAGEVVVPVAERPVAAFTLSTTLGDGPLSVTATDTSTNSPTSWKWRFVDGGATIIESTEQNPTVSLTPGFWSVTFWATNSAGTGVEFAVNAIIVRTPAAPYAITDTSSIPGTTPINIRQISTSFFGDALRVSPTGTDNVIEWHFGDFYGLASYGNGQLGMRPVRTGIRTVGAKIIEPNGAEYVVTRSINVTSQGYNPVRTYVPVPTRTWPIPAGETLLTTESRYNESSTGGKRPDRFVLRFDPGDVSSSETIVVRDESGAELQSYGVVGISSHDDGSINGCHVVCWIDIAPSERKTLWILKKTGSRAYGTNTMTTGDVTTAIGGDVVIDLLDVRKADNHATTYGDWTIDLSTDGLDESHTVKQHACQMYARFKTSAYAKDGSSTEQKTHAYAYFHVWQHPDTAALWVSIEAMVNRGFVKDYIDAASGPTGIYEIIYKARLRVGATVVKDWAREFSFPASAINITNNRVVLTGHGVKADSFWKWLSSSGSAPTGITVGSIYGGQPLGYLYRYEDSAFQIREPGNINRNGPFFDFTDQGTGTHTLQQYIYQAVGKSWKVADTDGRDLWLAGTKTEINPAWYRDEFAWRAQKGLVPPLTVDVADDQSQPLRNYPEQVSNYYPGTGAIARGSRDTPGGDDMIGPVHRIYMLWARGPETAMGRYWLRCLRVGAAEGCSVASNMVWELDSGTNSRPRYEHLVMNLGPNKDGNTYTNMGPVRGETQLHHNNFGSDGSKIGDRGIHIYGNIDMSHPDHCTWTDFPLTGSGISLDTTIQLWSRSAIFWAQRYSTSETAGRNHYLPGETYYVVSFVNGGFQTRSAGYMSKFLSLGLMLADEIPSRAMVKDIVDDNISVIKRYISDTTLMAAILRKYGIARANTGFEQMWMLQILCFGALWAIKARGKFASEATATDFYTRFPRMLAGDDVAGEGVLAGPPGYHAGCLGLIYSYKGSTQQPEDAYNGLREVDMAGAVGLNDLFFDVADYTSCTAGSGVFTRIMGPSSSRKLYDGQIIRFSSNTGQPTIAAGLSYRQRYYVYNYNHVDKTFQVSSTPGPAWTPVVPTSSSSGMVTYTQSPGRSSSRWPAANDYSTGQSTSLSGDGEYLKHPQAILSCAALWGRSDLLPHARHMAKAAYGATDGVPQSSAFELLPNTAITDGYLRYSMTPEYPPLS